MIGWKVDAYYSPNIFANPSNISDFTLVQSRGNFTLLTVPYDLLPTVNMTFNKLTDLNPFAQELFNSLGQDYGTVYAIYARNQSQYYNYKLYSTFFEYLFPSLPLAFPKFAENAKNQIELSGFTNFAIRFKNGVFLVNNPNTSNVLGLLKDGVVSTISDASAGNFPFSGANVLCSVNNFEPRLYLWGIDNYVDEKSLLNGLNFYSYSFSIVDNRNGTYTLTVAKSRLSSVPNYNKIYINNLFGNNDKDYDRIVPDNPYEPGGPSGPTDPDLPPGTFDDESDPIPDSPLPTLSAANTGFTRIYNPTLSQVQALARYLWTDPDVIQTIWNHIKQFFEDPMEAIIGFNLVPVPVPDGGTENFALMYIDTGVQMTVAANQFVDLDCGTLELKRYYGSALDQSPYTKVSCYLPYIGTVNLNTDEVMGTTLQVKYRVDIVSGSCVAKIFVDGNCLYQYSGHCAITIPISSADFSSYVSAAISVGKLAAAAITAGAGAAMAAGVGEVAQQTNQVVTTTQTTSTARNPATGRQITTGTTTTVQTRESPADQSSTQASFSGLSPQNVANTVGAIMSSKPHIEHSGSFSGNSGYLGVRRPFVIIERPNMCMPDNYQALNGFPAMITMELGTCKGFTRVQQVQLTGLHATNPEQAEILELLKSGVIL